MAEYRSGLFAEANSNPIAAAKGNNNIQHMTGTSAFYHAMSLFQQGSKDAARKLVTLRRRPDEAAATHKDEETPLAGDASPDDPMLWLTYSEGKALIESNRCHGRSNNRIRTCDLTVPNGASVSIGSREHRFEPVALKHGDRSQDREDSILVLGME